MVKYKTFHLIRSYQVASYMERPVLTTLLGFWCCNHDLL